MSDKTHFVVKRNLQKSKNTGVYFSDVVTPEILTDVSNKLMGVSDCSVDYVTNEYKDNYLDTGYNKGRMAIMEYEGEVSYISFSEQTIGGRNSSVQSVPTAFNMYYMNECENKHLYYYFLNFDGNGNTEYQILMYRLMKTVGFSFINEEAIGVEIKPFTSIDDIMNSRKINSSRNRSNNSTYITKSSVNQYDVYGKTYGANKYETSMMCYALSKLAKPYQSVTLYEVLEKDLKELPQASRDVLSKMGNINVVATDMQLEKKSFERDDSLRSPRYIYNLLDKLGPKHCALCNCEIPELIQGAHVFPVADIKRVPGFTLDQRIEYATDGNNGIWLCQNDHKMFDQGLITFTEDGEMHYKDNLEEKYLNFMKEVTINAKLEDTYLSEEFKEYLRWRNDSVA